MAFLRSDVDFRDTTGENIYAGARNSSLTADEVGRATF